MKDLKKFYLGNEALGYIKDILSRGNSLSHSVLTHVKFEEGEIITYLPKDTSIEDAKLFEYGGKLESPIINKRQLIPNTNHYLSNIIKSYLNCSQKHICLLEDVQRKPNDFVTEIDDHSLLLNGEIFYFLIAEDKKEKIERAIEIANNLWHFLGVASSLPYNISFPEGYISENTLNRIAINAEIIVIGAYDGEGFLIWHKDSIFI